MPISLKELKKNRLTPAEKWLTDLIEGVEPETYPSGSVQWWKNGRWLFEQGFKIGKLTVIRLNIVLYLEKEFGLKGDEIFEVLNNVLYDYTDNGKLKIIY